MHFISWKRELNINSNNRKTSSIERKKKSYGKIDYYDQNQQSDDLYEYNEESIQEEYMYFSSSIFSEDPDSIDNSLNFFDSHLNFINAEIFEQFLIILSNNFITPLDFKIIESTNNKLLSLIEKSIRLQYSKIFQKEEDYNKYNIYDNIIPIIKNIYENDSTLVKSALKILKTISIISYNKSYELFEKGIINELSELFNFLSEKQDAEDWDYVHRDIFESLFDLLFGLFHYPELFIEEPSRIQFLHYIYTNLPSFILEDLSDSFKSPEIDLSLSFIRQIFVISEKIEDFYENFNDLDIFQWVIELFCSNENEQNQINASDAIVAITASYDEFSSTLIENQLFVDFFDDLDAGTKICDQIKCHICIILRNLAANENKEVVDFVFNRPNIMYFLKFQMNGQFIIKYEALNALLNLILCLKNEMEEYFIENLDILPFLVESIQSIDNESFILIDLESILNILLISENKQEENIFARVFYYAGLLDVIDQFDDTEKCEEIFDLMNAAKNIVVRSLYFDNLGRVEEEEEADDKDEDQYY